MKPRNKLVAIMVVSLSLVALFFNNCARISNSGSSSQPSTASYAGGGGYDGKVYNFQRFDPVRCSDLSANGQPAPNAVVQVSPYNQSPRVQLVRENCAAITPVPLAETQYSIVADGSILFNERAYHAETPNTFAPIGFSLLTPDYQSYWGGGKCIIDSLWNSEIGNGGKVASQRFRAPFSGAIASIRTFFSDGAGSRGTGGTVRVRLYRDDGSANHLPNFSAGVLAEGTYVPNLLNGNFQTNGRFTEVLLNSLVPLTAGEIYHLFYENTDANSLQNYISLESQATGPAHGRPCRFLSPVDWGFTRSQYSTALTDMTQKAEAPGYFVPILQVRMNSGQIFGSANIDSGNFAASVWTVRANQPIRERLILASTRTASQILVHTASSVAGTLNWALKDGATILASGTVSELVPNYRVGVLLDVGGAGFYDWYTLALPSPVTLQPGRAYDLEFSVADGSEWRFADQAEGSGPDFAAPAIFAESRAEHWNGTAWISNASHWRILFRN